MPRLCRQNGSVLWRADGALLTLSRVAGQPGFTIAIPTAVC
jgi:hypothetical protein